MSATNTAPHGETTVSLGDEAACVDTADEAIAINVTGRRVGFQMVLTD